MTLPASRTRTAVLAALIVVGAVARPTATGQAPPAAAVVDAAGREEAALDFVNEHHPELASLLARLKAMRPSEYAKAIRELWQVSRSLGNLKARDPKRYELGLELWKARSRVNLLAARLAAASPGEAADLESQLLPAVEAQIAVESRQARYDRDLAEARLRRLTQTVKRLEADPSALAEVRRRAILKKSQRARRRPAVAPSKPVKPSPNQGASS